MSQAQKFVFFLTDEFSHLAFSCAVEPLRIANLISGKDLYEWSLHSENGEFATSSNGTKTIVDGDFNSAQKSRRLLVLSGINMRNHVSRPLLSALRRERAKGTEIGALCSGAWILAEAGFLNGCKAAIHWEYHDSFMEEFPDVNLVRNVFVADEKHITASGGTATADLMLHLIEADHGEDLALDVADQMVYVAVRNATAEQRVSLQSRNGMRNKHLVKAIRIMRDQIDDPIPPSSIATKLGISTRQLERLFGKYLNSTPKKYYVEMRLDRARKLLLQTEDSVTDISIACGYESSGHFSKVYRARFGVSPQAQRNKIS